MNIKRVCGRGAVLMVLPLLLAWGPTGCGPAEKNGEKNMQPAANGDCGWVREGDLTVVDDLDQRLDSYVPVELSPDISHLDATQNRVLEKLVAASRLMNDIFRIQATPCREELLARLGGLPEGRREMVARYFRINVGPWDRR